MKNYLKYLLSFLLLATFTPIEKTFGQNLESFFQDIKNRHQKKEWIKINGGINLNALFNSMHLENQRTDPFSIRFNANLNVDFMGIKAPFSASFSDGNKVYNLPSYAFYGISPSYKWIQLHLGDRTMEFSPYSLSGHNFKGAGIELSPGKFRFSAMKGQLKRANAEDLQQFQNIEPVYTRKGWGIKTGFESDKNSLLLMVFKAEDDPASLQSISIPESLTPEENTVLGVESRHTLFEKISLEIDYGLSGMTRNSHSPELDHSKLLRRMGGLFVPKQSSGFFQALKTNLGVELPFGKIGFSQERIDPGYKTLGTLFFNNDLQRYSGTFNTSLLKNKVTLNGNLGVQHNNIKSLSQNTQKRIIGALNLGFQSGKRFTLNLSMSNLSNTNLQRVVSLSSVHIDSLLFVQTNKQVNLNATYQIDQQKNRQSSISFMGSYQQSNSIENEMVNKDQLTNFMMGNVSYVFSNRDKGLNINASFLINQMATSQLKSMTLAPGFSITKKVLNDSGNIGLTASYSDVFLNNSRGNSIFNLRFNGSIKVYKKHNVNIGLGWVRNRSTTIINGYDSFQEFTGNIGYGWSF